VTVDARAKGTVLLAAPRGFCAGVDRAVLIVEQALERFGPPVYVRRQIVHNTHVVAGLSARGAVFVDELDRVPEGSVVVFSAHGVAPSVRSQAEARELTVIDATCPLVAKVHAEALRFARDGYTIALIGHEDHEEVEGTRGEVPEHIRVVSGPADVENLDVGGDGAGLVWLSQTTLAVDEVAQTADALRARFPRLVDPPGDDICYASQNRQNAVKAIAARCDLVLVVGSANSSNSVRLVEVARGAGARAAYLVDDAAGLREEWFADGANIGTVGVTAGASAPEYAVRDLLKALAQRGYADVEEVTSAVETVTFELPARLRAPQ
jgi:4-hydroxy-3-methylbut-2-enyl diphosphate reductase